jgi:hypothetical protein
MHGWHGYASVVVNNNLFVSVFDVKGLPVLSDKPPTLP